MKPSKEPQKPSPKATTSPASTSSKHRIMSKGVTLDQPSVYLAAYLSWARQARVYATTWPLIIYRGHACATWPLLPALCRQKNAPSQMLRQWEAEVAQEFRNRCGLTDWPDIEVLAYARHHGAPTRLLDWSRNPIVALWFAVSDAQHDKQEGLIFQLSLAAASTPQSLMLYVNGPPKIPAGKDCSACNLPVHVFQSPHRVERTARQGSTFSIASFQGDYARRPLDEILRQQKPRPLRAFPVYATAKPELRRLLSDLGLDAHSIYGDPDSLGKALTTRFDLSDLPNVNWASAANLPPEDAVPYWPANAHPQVPPQPPPAGHQTQ
jgi:hypothetical protein